MPGMNTKRLLQYFGGQSEMARALGVHRQSVHTWVKTGHIPAKRQAQIEHVSKGKFKAKAKPWE